MIILYLKYNALWCRGGFMKEFEKYLGERVKNSNYSFCNGLKITLDSENFNGCSLKRTSLMNSEIKNSSFFQCAFTGSRFNTTTFKSCKIQYVNFQFSTFIRCDFFDFSKRTTLLGNNYDHCYFYKVNFYKVNFKGCSMSCSYFFECTFTDCTFRATTFECAQFQECKFLNVNMAELNIEYSQFMNCILNNIIFPYTQLPYIIGFSEFDYNANIKIAADDMILSFDEYQSGFEDLIEYYKFSNENFPIANIFLFKKNTATAFDILKRELSECLSKSDYRVAKHICRLSTFNDKIGISKTKELFKIVKKHLDKIDDQTQTLECLHNIDEIRRLTLDAAYNKRALKIIIETNIPSTDLDGIQSIIKTVEETISETLQNCYSKSIEIRHNSPYELFVKLYQNLPEIEQVVNSIINAIPIVASGLTIVCSSLTLKDRIKKKCKKSLQGNSNITKITIIIE